MADIASLFDSLCFCGHTHIPDIFHRSSSRDRWDYTTPEECDYQYAIAGEKLICNVGSVGQPRDGDSRASYVLFAPDRIYFRRVEYDIDRTIRKMRDAGDDDFGGQRLREGR
jgi:diadenosine tetraphosphatase ApaH/serine/threonine PP2A family protein phosphatase